MQSIAGVEVTVTSKNSAGIYSGCNTGPYWIGNTGTPNGYLYEFKSVVTPKVNVTTVRVELTNLNSGEIVSFRVNGHFFPISQSDLSVYHGTCILPVSDAINGKVGALQSNTGASVLISSTTPIDSIFVAYEQGSTAGVHYSFEFQSDPRVMLTQSALDTVLCIGDTVRIPYTVTTAFNGDNAFHVELSDAEGNFTQQRIIGTIYAAGGGIIQAVIPDTTPRGDAYRLRITSTSPARISELNDKNLRISPFPVVDASNNGPICVGDELKLSVKADDSSTFLWKGPANFVDTAMNPIIDPMSNDNAGRYTVTANLYGCESSDTISVGIKPTPSVSTATNNSPICEGETLNFSATADQATATLAWRGPNNAPLEGAKPSIANAKVANNGTYSVTATLDGCVSDARTTDVRVKILPEVPYINANSPLRIGDELKLSGGTGTPGVSYLWTGPEGFTYTEQTPPPIIAYNYPDNTYGLTVTLEGCSTSTSIHINVIPEQQESLYPNPNNGTFTVKLNLDKNESKRIAISIINDIGQTIQREEGETKYGAMIKTITVRDHIPPGVYLLRMATSKRTTDLKFIYRK